MVVRRMSDDQRGIYQKYRVTYSDGSPVNHETFVLSPETDESARKALITYAMNTPNKCLASDLLMWMSLATANQKKAGDLDA